MINMILVCLEFMLLLKELMIKLKNKFINKKNKKVKVEVSIAFNTKEQTINNLNFLQIKIVFT